ncbi:MAG: hypothetical protein N2319_03515 [Candidatus Kapabacteria bacterium]|nr:hypothetical protein [Candidatus Kapabacteria bacterium]
MNGKYPRAEIKKLFMLDFHFRMFSIFFILSMLPLLFGWAFIAITFVLNISTILVCIYRYNYINGCLKNGVVIKGTITKILRQIRKRHYIELDSINNDCMEGLYVLEMSYSFNSKEFKIKAPITYLRYMPDFNKGQEIEILVNPKNPKKYIVKSIWVPADYISIS